MLYKARNVVLIFSACILIVCTPGPRYLPQSQLERDPAIIHEHVGEYIDTQEREYYGLFHGIQDFREAVFFNRKDGGFDILIVSEYHTYYAVYDASQAEEIVHDYIESFDEKDSSGKNFEKQWNVVGYDTLGLPVTKNDVDRVLAKRRVTMQMIYGGCVTGFLGAMIGWLDVEANVDQATHIPSCSGTEDIPFWTVGGCLAGAVIVNSLEKSSIKKDPIPHINKKRGPWVVE